jgi:hypothetical protein
MDGLGWHDHSRGSRDMKDMGRHAWIHGNLSRGRSFALTANESLVDGKFIRILDKVVIWDEGKLYHATCPNVPLLESNARPAPTFDFTLIYEKGSIDVHAKAVRCLPHSTTRYMECFDGVCPGLAHIVTYEQGSIFIADGEECNGHSERSYRL